MKLQLVTIKELKYNSAADYIWSLQCSSVKLCSGSGSASVSVLSVCL